MTVLTYHLSVTGHGIRVNYETLRRIAHLIGANGALAIRCIGRQIEAVRRESRPHRRRIGNIHRVYGQVTKVTRVRIWKCLVEDIEEPDPKLELLGLGYVEVLEEGDIKILSCRTTHIKRRLGRAVGSKLRH